LHVLNMQLKLIIILLEWLNLKERTSRLSQFLDSRVREKTR
jgi:hypothetical protein